MIIEQYAAMVALVVMLIFICILLIYVFVSRKKANALKDTIADLIHKKEQLTKGIDELIFQSKTYKDKFDTDKELLKNELNCILQEKQSTKSEILLLQEDIENLSRKYANLESETKHLQILKKRESTIENDIIELESKQKNMQELISSLHKIKAKVDLYSRIEDFVEYGHYEIPQYLYETTDRFAIEIKKVREEQKDLILNAGAFKNTTRDTSFLEENKLIAKTIDTQKKLIIRTFNIECDFLIEKVNPSNITRTLERIVNIADNIEKLCVDLRFGITSDYVGLKLEECSLQYQFTLKKKEEQEEQRAIREQMREEEKARKEYEKSLLDAEKEEDMYQKLLVKAQETLAKATEAERSAAELRIQQLEEELKIAKEKSERVKSMAEQTKRGHVYIISNIGSFGENIYKIGLTRRLDPMDRVKELGDASVPFSFDVHAMIAAEDAPKMETDLHREFAHRRVNAVNLRKEFFNVSLDEISQKVNEITGKEVDFITTIAAEEYYQSKRLREKTTQS